MAKASLFIAASATAILVAANLYGADAGDPNHPTGSTGLILIDKIGSHVQFFNPSTWTHNLNAPQNVLTVGKDPMGLAFSADGKTAVVANHGDGSISVIDLQSLKVTGNHHAGQGVETLAWY